jgi:nicotinamide phosphoribosyltransferase
MSFNLRNPILNTDSYKPSHFLQTPEGTVNQFSYIESRGGVYDKTLFCGLQPLLLEYLTTPITQQDIEEADAFLTAHGEPFNREGWQHILDVHGGLFPISIKAVPEGLIIPTHNVLVTIEATDPKCAWLVSYVETMGLRAVWYMTTVATQSWSIKQLIKGALEKTGDVNGLPFKLHDFGARGVSSFESAGLGGCAHLFNFMGSDTITGALFARRYYLTDAMPAFSIPAAEHSTITPFGREGEVAAYRNMIKKFSKEGSLYAVVSDSYDIYNACENLWGGELKDEVIGAKGILVVRPDSGHPASVVLKCIQILDSKFGSVVNDKGYKVLNNVRVIQGDGINEKSILEIIGFLMAAGYSIDNVAFGMGGALLQQINRDTQKFAMKCSAIAIDGYHDQEHATWGDKHVRWYDVYKDPITDSGKRSKKGRLKLVRWLYDGSYRTMNEDEFIKGPTEDVLVEVFRNGKILKTYTLEEVRANTEK